MLMSANRKKLIFTDSSQIPPTLIHNRFYAVFSADLVNNKLYGRWWGVIDFIVYAPYRDVRFCNYYVMRYSN